MSQITIIKVGGHTLRVLHVLPVWQQLPGFLNGLGDGGRAAVGSGTILIFMPGNCPNRPVRPSAWARPLHRLNAGDYRRPELFTDTPACSHLEESGHGRTRQQMGQSACNPGWV